jgi:hypothetical protein
MHAINTSCPVECPDEQCAIAHGCNGSCPLGPQAARATAAWIADDVERQGAVHVCSTRFLGSPPLPMSTFSYEVYFWGTPRFAVMDATSLM